MRDGRDIYSTDVNRSRDQGRNFIIVDLEPDNIPDFKNDVCAGQIPQLRLLKGGKHILLQHSRDPAP